jgi:hypothetical protein
MTGDDYDYPEMTERDIDNFFINMFRDYKYV